MQELFDLVVERCTAYNNLLEFTAERLYELIAYLAVYVTALYNNMLAGWNRYETTAYSQVCSKKKEAIWMNCSPPAKQMSFEDYGGMLWKD